MEKQKTYSTERHPAGKAVAKPYYSTVSKTNTRASGIEFSRIAELQAKAKMLERNYPSGYQGL
jgi:hypothetical protein